MSFIYPRIITVTRAIVDEGLGAVNYNALQPVNEQTVCTAIPASIQLDSTRGKPVAGVPGDAAAKTFWKVLIPLFAVSKGTIQVRDILTDDLGVRYQVVAPYYNSLGYGLRCERLET